MKILFSEDRIRTRVDEIGREISRDYLGLDLVIIGILNGGFIFTADLCRAIAIPHEIDFLGASSYGNEQVSSGHVNFTKNLKHQITGRSVLIVEDIVDTGKTLESILNELENQKPKDLRVSSLFWKKEKANPKITVHYPGFIISDEFLVGYGLDYAGKFRNLPYVAAYDPKID